jgi:phosphatidate cytidylyltransferase
MTNLQKRILTAFVILPLSLFFIIKGGWFLIFFLIFVLFTGLHEAYTSFKKEVSILFLSLILSLAVASIYFLRSGEGAGHTLLYFAIAVCISSDIGGYVFGKIFKWKKLTSISPKKTISGAFGSYFFSLICFVIFVKHHNFAFNLRITEAGYIVGAFFTIILSTIAQAGDLIISYFKRMEKIKDTGKILPGHGGIFDRIDGLMFVVIFAYFINYFNFL